jgi:hypothetical protein
VAIGQPGPERHAPFRGSTAPCCSSPALLVEGNALAQSSVVLSVAARVVAPCTTSSTRALSTCSSQTLARQSDIADASARISTSGGETTVTHRGGPSPKIDTQGNRVSVSFWRSYNERRNVLSPPGDTLLISLQGRDAIDCFLGAKI